MNWYTIICGWHEMALFHVQSHDATTAAFKAQCQAWKWSFEHHPTDMYAVKPDDVQLVAVLEGRHENLYPFLERP